MSESSRKHSVAKLKGAEKEFGGRLSLAIPIRGCEVLDAIPPYRLHTGATHDEPVARRTREAERVLDEAFLEHVCGGCTPPRMLLHYSGPVPSSLLRFSLPLQPLSLRLLFSQRRVLLTPTPLELRLSLSQCRVFLTPLSLSLRLSRQTHLAFAVELLSVGIQIRGLRCEASLPAFRRSFPRTQFGVCASPTTLAFCASSIGERFLLTCLPRSAWTPRRWHRWASTRFRRRPSTRRQRRTGHISHCRTGCNTVDVIGSQFLDTPKTHWCCGVVSA